MGLNDIFQSPEWPIKSWPFICSFWYKNDLDAYLDAWAKYDLLLLNKSNLS